MTVEIICNISFSAFLLDFQKQKICKISLF